METLIDIKILPRRIHARVTTIATTIANIIKANSAVINNPSRGGGSYVNGNTITGKDWINGNVLVTGGTATVTCPTAAVIVTALGFTPGIGTYFDTIVSNIGMTGGNVLTIAVGANMTAYGLPATATTLTLTQSATSVACFRTTFFSTTDCILTRVY